MLPSKIIFIGYLVRALGPEDFGLVAISLGVLSSLSMLQLGNAVALGKRLNQALANDDERLFQTEFSNGCMLVGITLIPIVAGLVLVQTSFWGALNIPPARALSGRIVVGAIGSQVIVSALGVPTSACMQALHRLDIHSKLTLASDIARMAATVTWFEVFSSDPVAYAVIMITCVSATRVVVWVWARSALPQARIRSATISWVKIKGLAMFNILAAMNNMSRAVFVQAPVFIVQVFGGLAIAGLYGVSAQLVLLSMGVLTTVTNPITPVVVSLQACKRAEQLKQLFVVLVRVYSLLGIFALVLLVTVGESLLDLWLKNSDPAPLIRALPFVGLMICMGLAGQATKPFLVAGEQLKWPVMVGAAAGLCMLSTQALLAWILHEANILMAVMGVGSVFFACYNLASIWIAAITTKAGMRSLVWRGTKCLGLSMGPATCVLVVAGLRGWGGTWLGLVTTVTCGGLLLVAGLFIFGLDGSERKMLLKAIKA
jgi:O-antigen/teichoic acid export membrane protein